MSVSLYNSSVPVIVQCLDNLSDLLSKGAAYAAEKEIDESVMTSARLFPTMFPLAKQVHICCDMVCRGGARVAGVELPEAQEELTSFAELQQRIDTSKAFLMSLDRAAMDAAADSIVNISAGPYELKFTGYSCINNWILPNMYFHITTVYNILRHNGVEIGKIDFLGGARLIS